MCSGVVTNVNRHDSMSPSSAEVPAPWNGVHAPVVSIQAPLDLPSDLVHGRSLPRAHSLKM
jgi:hypothetical protein